MPVTLAQVFLNGKHTVHVIAVRAVAGQRVELLRFATPPCLVWALNCLTADCVGRVPSQTVPHLFIVMAAAFHCCCKVQQS